MIGTRDDGAERLVAWALGTFHASVVVLALLLLLFATGALAGILGGLNTAVGFALFLALWATTTFATRRALEDPAWSAPIEGQSRFLGRALRWGGVNGILFLALASVQLSIFISLGGAQTVLFALAFVLVAAPFAFVIAFAVGATVGLLLGAIDLALFAVSRRIVGMAGIPAERRAASGNSQEPSPLSS